MDNLPIEILVEITSWLDIKEFKYLLTTCVVLHNLKTNHEFIQHCWVKLRETRPFLPSRSVWFDALACHMSGSILHSVDPTRIQAAFKYYNNRLVLSDERLYDDIYDQFGQLIYLRILWNSLSKYWLGVQFECYISLLKRVEVEDTTFEESTFIGMKLPKSSVKNCTLIDCNFERTKLRSSNFIGCKILRCSFVGADLRNCDFTGTKLHDCDFVNATMRCVDFSDAILTDINLTGVSAKTIQQLSVDNKTVISDITVSSGCEYALRRLMQRIEGLKKRT